MIPRTQRVAADGQRVDLSLDDATGAFFPISQDNRLTRRRRLVFGGYALKFPLKLVGLWPLNT